MKFYNCDIYKFKELISNKKLVCFGAGRGLRNFLQYYGSEHIEQCIHCIADNMYEYMEKEIQGDLVTSAGTKHCGKGGKFDQAADDGHDFHDGIAFVGRLEFGQPHGAKRLRCVFLSAHSQIPLSFRLPQRLFPLRSLVRLSRTIAYRHRVAMQA